MRAVLHTPALVSLEATPAAVVRGIVPMSELTDYFDRAFGSAAAELGHQGVPVTGPPVAVYFGTPSETVDVAGGFPCATPIAPAGTVSGFTLPAGRAARIIHQGSYDSLADTYDALLAWMGARGLTPASVMWESYLTEPGGDPAAQLTEITWPVED